MRDLQSVLHVLWALAVQLSVRIFKDMVSSHMDGHILFPQPLIQTLQLLAEIPKIHTY